jgi:hypothetical protein
LTLTPAEIHDLARVSRLGLVSSDSIAEPLDLPECECPNGVPDCCGLCPGTISEPCCTIDEEDEL